MVIDNQVGGAERGAHCSGVAPSMAAERGCRTEAPKELTRLRKPTEDPLGRHGLSYSQSKQTSEGSNAESMAMLAGFSNSTKEVKGTVDSVSDLKGNVKNLEDKLNDGFEFKGRRITRNLEEK